MKVVISRTEYTRLTQPKPGFVELMRASPLAGLALDMDRSPSLTRDTLL